MLTPIRRRHALLPVTALVVLLGVASALAHARLQRSSPADKAVLRAAPARLDFWFSELLDEGFNTVDVYPSAQLNTTNHVNLAKDAPVVDATDRTHMSVGLKPLDPGSYIVDYRVLSRDGHTAPGRITFTFTPSK